MSTESIKPELKAEFEIMLTLHNTAGFTPRVKQYEKTLEAHEFEYFVNMCKEAGINLPE